MGAAFRFSFAFFFLFFLFLFFRFAFFKFFFGFEVGREGPGEGFRVGLRRSRDPHDGEQRHGQDDECRGGEAAPAPRPARKFVSIRHPRLNRPESGFS
ncbi:MAG TPA: hypothetical protein VNY83_05980 [Solirubrobacterales bacterium]|jgi:hypothetical protein|nr:hypothetical protein [Solirubrobacterales bacterium]